MTPRRTGSLPNPIMSMVCQATDNTGTLKICEDMCPPSGTDYSAKALQVKHEHNITLGSTVSASSGPMESKATHQSQDAPAAAAALKTGNAITSLLLRDAEASLRKCRLILDDLQALEQPLVV